MLSKSQISLLKSLQHKKDRIDHGLFLVEGYKSVIEFIHSSYQAEAIYHTASFDPKMLKLSRKINLCEISVSIMEKISGLKAPQDVAALIKIPAWPSLNNAQLKQKFAIVLDGIQDPGNMGTIIRTADWFGIGQIICSPDTVDVYNPKVVQASMGSLSRIKVFYTDLETALTQIGVPVLVRCYRVKVFTKLTGSEGLIVMGNEGNGIRPGLQRLIGTAVTIPRAGEAESLNVGIATALFCSEIRRNSNNNVGSQ